MNNALTYNDEKVLPFLHSDFFANDTSFGIDTSFDGDPFSVPRDLLHDLDRGTPPPLIKSPTLSPPPKMEKIQFMFDCNDLMDLPLTSPTETEHSEEIVEDDVYWPELSFGSNASLNLTLPVLSEVPINEVVRESAHVKVELCEEHKLIAPIAKRKPITDHYLDSDVKQPIKQHITSEPKISDKEKIRKTPNCYMLFRRDIFPTVKQELMLKGTPTNTELSLECARRWKEANNETKKAYKIKAKLKAIEHKIKYPGVKVSYKKKKK